MTDRGPSLSSKPKRKKRRRKGIPKATVEFLKTEYPAVNTRWITIQGLRYGGIIFLATANGGLGKAFQLIFDIARKIPLEPNPIYEGMLVGIPIAAIVITATVYFFQLRMEELDVLCSERAARIEVALGAPDGLSNKIIRRFRPWRWFLPARHRAHEILLLFIFALIVLAWIGVDYRVFGASPLFHTTEVIHE